MTRVLVVDDDEDLARHMARQVRRQGWGTGVAYDGVEAVLQVLDGGWEAVLMDIRMPSLDGLGALKLMRRHSGQSGPFPVSGSRPAPGSRRSSPAPAKPCE